MTALGLRVTAAGVTAARMGVALGIAGVILLQAACSQNGAPPATAALGGATPALGGRAADNPSSPFEITATLRELMDSTVDPAADSLWDSVAYIAKGTGIEDRYPKTEEDWAAVRRHAVTLMEAMNLVVMEGRQAAPPGTQPGVGELKPEEIDHRIASNRAAFVAFAKSLRATTQKALLAIDKKDPQALMRAGGEIDDACEACHVTFWYPPQP